MKLWEIFLVSSVTILIYKAVGAAVTPSADKEILVASAENPHIKSITANEVEEAIAANEESLCPIRSKIFHVEKNDIDTAQKRMNAWQSQNNVNLLNIETITQVTNRGMTTVIRSLVVWYTTDC